MKQFKNILYIAEARAGQEQGNAMARAVSLAENNQANLTVMGVVPEVTAGFGMPPGGPISNKLQPFILSQKRSEMESLVAPYLERRKIRIEILVGRMFLEVIQAVLRNQFDLLIKPAENPDFLERLFGSEDMHLLRKCPCPIWLTGPNENPNYTCILAAVDFDIGSLSNTQEQGFNQHILDLASSLALSDFAELHVVHVWDAPAEMTVRSCANNPDQAGMEYVEGERICHEMAFNRLRDQLSDQLGKVSYDYLSPQFHLRRGNASTDIPVMAKQLKADLVVMGTVARIGIAGLFIGNTAETILEQLQSSVLAIKPPGFVSPIKLSE